MDDKKKIKAFIAIEDDKEYEARKKLNEENLEKTLQGVRDELSGAITMVKADEKKESKKDPEEKEYILLLSSASGDVSDTWWEVVTGRTAAYEYLKQYVETLEIHDSYVLVEGVLTENRISVYRFLRYIQDKEFYNDSFDIEDYNVGSYEDMDEFDKATYDERHPDGGNIPRQNDGEQEATNEKIHTVSPFTHFEVNEENV